MPLCQEDTFSAAVSDEDDDVGDNEDEDGDDDCGEGNQDAASISTVSTATR